MEASILILCWNYEKYIQQCLHSIFNQTQDSFEILFLDNASKDNSFQVAKSLLADSGFRHQVYKNETPQSVTKNFNFLLEKSSGEFIFPFSADDWMAPDNVAEKIALLKAQPSVGVVFGGGWYFYEHLNAFSQVNIERFKRGNMVRDLLLDRESYFHPGPAYRRKIIYEVGKWDETLLVEDLDLNLRVAMKYQVDFVPKPLVYYRRHAASFLSNYNLMHRGLQQYVEKYKEHKELPMKKWMASNYKFFSLEALDQRAYATALDFLYKAFKTAPGVYSIETAFAFLKRYLSQFKVVRGVWLPLKLMFMNRRRGQYTEGD